MASEVRLANGAPGLRGSQGDARHHLLTSLFGTPDLHLLGVYRKHGGYESLEKALTQLEPEHVHAEVKTSGLRGRGGAGFPTGTKWGFVPKPTDVPGPRYVVVNADESEPGTSKDRYLMENSPHMLLEGALIACFAVGAHQAWIYIRGEYDRPYRMLLDAIAELRGAGILGDRPFGADFPLDVQVYRGHGAYICGEETALLESLEGKRAQPRSRPPFPAVKGAWGRPTLLNNVETLANLPWILRHGGATYAELGTERSRGTRLLSVSGNVQRPGVYEVELGVSFRHVILELAGGPPPGRRVKCFWPGGSSAPVLPESMLDTSTDLDELARAGSMGGSGGVIVMDDAHCVVRAAARLLRFYAHESCGKCTPCRVGGNWAVRTFRRILAGQGGPVDLQVLDRIQESLQNGRCLCGLGDSAGWVIMSTMRHFPEEYEAHALHGACPSGECSQRRKDARGRHASPADRLPSQHTGRVSEEQLDPPGGTGPPSGASTGSGDES
ncbi:MAG TPA: NADH-quinone oxidoreductase subunit NuoF [Methylomirabilota bacterium]|nr:NADH-quinone oxidoreductase subunit NuoF [Methylomirabilota bacterium]